MHIKTGFPPLNNLVAALTMASRICLGLAAGLILASCTAGETSASSADASSSVYTLATVAGNPVPADISHDGTSLQVRSGAFTINADGTCSAQTVFVPPSNKEVTRNVSGTYIKDGPTLTMQWKGAGKTVGKLEGDTFTMNNEGTVFVYKK